MKNFDTYTYQRTQPLLLPEVRKTLAGLSLLENLDLHFAWEDIVRHWLLNSIRGLSPTHDLFSNIYVEAGVNSCIEKWFISETRNIVVLRDEYPFLFGLAEFYKKKLTLVDSLNNARLNRNDILYISNPHYKNGFIYDLSQISCAYKLDVSFLGSCFTTNICINSFCEEIWLGASKSFGLESFRTAFRFTKKNEPIQAFLKKSYTLPNIQLNALSLLMNRYQPEDLPKIYHADYQAICKEQQLNQTNCLWTAWNQKKIVSTSNWLKNRIDVATKLQNPILSPQAPAKHQLNL